MPYISFKDGNPHTLKILNDKISTLKDKQGKEIEGVKYLVEENGEHKTFFTSSISLISKLADVEEGTEVIIQMRSRKTEDGSWQSYYEVANKSKVAKDMGEIPIIEDDESILDIPDTEEPTPSF